jgi:hypothetical protein
MSTIFRVFVVLAAALGAYVFFGQVIPSLHHFAFPVGGMGVTWLALVAVGTGGIALKVTA